MIDITPQVVEQLNTVLPTQYGMILDTSLGLPCITYIPIENRDEALGNTQAYSTITYKIRIWCNEVSNITQYQAQVDEALASIGRFHRNGVQDIIYGDLICRMLDYTILVKEIFNISRYE